MNTNNPFQLIQTGSRLLLGTIGTFVEILENLQKPEENPTTTQQQLTDLIKELETKGKQIQQNPEQLIQKLLSPITDCDSKYPIYINRGGMQDYPQPAQLTNYELYGFIIEGNSDSLQKLCDRDLNTPSGGKTNYKPVTNLVLVTFGKSSDVKSLPLKNRGSFSEIEVIMWVLTMEGKQAGPFFIVDRLAWFIPYIFVDNSYVMASGREVFGFPKQLSWLNFPDNSFEPENLNVPENLSLEAIVLKNFSPDTKATREKIIEVSLTEKGDRNLGASSCNSLNELFKDIVQTLFKDNGLIEIPSLGLNIRVLDYLNGDVEVPMVFLKQFRDIKYGDRACYQAIVEAPNKLLAFRSGGLLSTGSEPSDLFKVKVNEFDSHPIVSELGLKMTGEQIAQAAFWANFDFRAEPGREIWRAS